MSDTSYTPDEPVEEAPLSLRETAEAAWQDIENDTDDAGGEPSAGQSARVRDNLGRFVSGEQTEVPAPAQRIDAPEGVQPHPAPSGSSNEPPVHWSAEDKALYQRLPQEARDFLTRRHSDMERDYQGKVQQSATAMQFTQALAPVFEEPRMKASLANIDGRPLHPVHAIEQWAQFHLRAMDPDPNVRMGLLQDLAQRMRLDPAALGRPPSPPPGLTEQDMADPAVKYFADTLGRSLQELNALKGQLQSIQAGESERENQAVLRATRQGIDSFADATDQSGNRLYPHFDAVLPQIIELYRANPSRDLREAYETAVWMAPTVRQGLLTRERSQVEQRRSNQRASLAVRSNTRGRTSPVSKPDGNGAVPKSLRETIAAAADEVGFEG